MAGSPENLIKCLKYRRHYYVELRSSGHGGRGQQYMMYHCVLCAESCNTKDALFHHLMSGAHKHNLNLAKLTLLKRNNRWPFSDGILLFDASIKEEMPSDSSGDLRRILQKSIDKDKALAIENFEYDAEIPRESTGYYLIHSHGQAQKIGKAKICYVRYGDVIEKIWCEWLGANDPNAEARDRDSCFNVIILPYRHGLGRYEPPENEIEANKCLICNQEMIVGKDVASILHSESVNCGTILCCSHANFRARYRDKGLQSPGSRIKEFHVFHTSCLIHWMLWCEYVQTIKLLPYTDIEEVEIEKVEHILEIICPKCNTNAIRDTCYNEFQMARVKSKILEAKNAWTQNPERSLQNSSIGLHFPLLQSNAQKAKFRTKFVQFYRAEYQTNDYPSQLQAFYDQC